MASARPLRIRAPTFSVFHPRNEVGVLHVMLKLPYHTTQPDRSAQGSLGGRADGHSELRAFRRHSTQKCWKLKLGAVNQTDFIQFVQFGGVNWKCCCCTRP